MNKRNYYSIHKNKKKRKSTTTSKIEYLKIANRVILNAMLIVLKAIELAKECKRIPKYKKGVISELAIVGDNNQERILNTIINHINVPNVYIDTDKIKKEGLINISERINHFIDPELIEKIKNLNLILNESK